MAPAYGVRERNEVTATKPVTRKRKGSVSIPEELQDIKTSLEGRKFLEKHILLCPPGEPTTHDSLSTCLHQISALPGLPKQALNAVRSVAFLLEELEENTVNETIRDAFDSQITEFTSDMQLLVQDVSAKVDVHMAIAMKEFTQNLKATTAAAGKFAAGRSDNGGNATRSYAAALFNPPAHANPRLAAREGIKVRQFVLTGLKEARAERRDLRVLKADVNKALNDLKVEGTIRSAIVQRDESMLLEADSDALAVWLTDTVNMVELCCALGEGVSFRPRSFNVLAMNVPLTIDTEKRRHREEIVEVNGLKENTVMALRWAKPVARRSPHQRTAHLVLSFSNAEAANRVISNGMTIANKVCHVEKVKKEPLRCLKCQGWNHMARECSSKADTCSNCAGPHRTLECRQPRTTRCVNCRSDSHASWDRLCPSFLRKAGEFNERYPDNLLPFFPTADPWTWSMDYTNRSNVTGNPSIIKAPDVQPKGKQRQSQPEQRELSMEKRYETIVLGPNWEEGMEGPNEHNGWWDEPTVKGRPTGSRMDTNNNAEGDAIAGPSNTTTVEYPNA